MYWKTWFIVLLWKECTWWVITVIVGVAIPRGGGGGGCLPQEAHCHWHELHFHSQSVPLQQSQHYCSLASGYLETEGNKENQLKDRQMRKRGKKDASEQKGKKDDYKENCQ